MNDPTSSDESSPDLPPPEPTSTIVDEIATSRNVDGVDADVASNVAADDIDLDAIEGDLNDVQTALERLNDGSYWTDEVTGETIPDDVLTAFPLTRTVATASAGETST